MIFNETSTDRIVWNRVRMIKDPDTGRRVSRANPRLDWQTAEAPDLRIVAEDLWQRAREVEVAKSHMNVPIETVTIHPDRPTSLFDVEVRGRLREVIRDEFRSGPHPSGGCMVARDRYIASATTAGLRFSYRSRVA
ncbi:hypothetical protein OCOJLMKI_4585 [Methylobacterium iners]|uniref:Uncharacterized protein n=2 Tax=Methylobacterium iners TaxID=418707 RepID=A0ABQ4S2J9_9HYPH|nr:hypothetical protein OCOJLMKI_4585 [Methylobacterium iners]